MNKNIYGNTKQKFNKNDWIFSVYEDRRGIVKEILEHDYYLISWLDGTETKVAREEIY